PLPSDPLHRYAGSRERLPSACAAGPNHPNRWACRHAAGRLHRLPSSTCSSPPLLMASTEIVSPDADLGEFKSGVLLPIDLQATAAVLQIEAGRGFHVEGGHAIVEVLTKGRRQRRAMGQAPVMGPSDFGHGVDLDHHMH